jgi:acyl-CoA reductase-like NAD-dependent aldehyde dehydrogenase
MTIQTMREFGIGEGQLYIGGRWIDSASKERREIANPKDESIVAAVPSSTTEDADRAVAAARKAQPEWSRRTPMERGALLQKLASLIDENSEALAHLLTAEGGKLLQESRIDANFAALLLRYAAESARRARSCPARVATSRSGSNACPMGWSPASPPGTSPPRCSPARSARRW